MPTTSTPRSSISSCSVSSEIQESAGLTIFTIALPPDPAVVSAPPMHTSSPAPHFFRRRVVLTAAQGQTTAPDAAPAAAHQEVLPSRTRAIPAIQEICSPRALHGLVMGYGYYLFMRRPMSQLLVSQLL
ncbi:hypothetical protein DFH09DRAFT_1314646 [Mycena vulgaris]|nr:hypothetical protein DFH09DRAFT_1314646 [Mycena vulgaris]